MVRWSHSSSHFDYTGHLEGKNNPKRGSFNSLSKVIWGCFGLALLRLVIGPENSCYSLNQSDAKRKPIMTWLPAFSRAWQLGCFCIEFSLALNDNFFPSHWLLSLFWFEFYDTQLKSALWGKNRTYLDLSLCYGFVRESY